MTSKLCGESATNYLEFSAFCFHFHYVSNLVVNIFEIQANHTIFRISNYSENRNMKKKKSLKEIKTFRKNV